jgi:Ca2+-binding EF-hand superfamily protein
MSSIGSIGSGVGGYAALQRSQPPSKEELFKRADADGSGGVDTSELQKMLAQRPGGTGSATEDSGAVDFSQLDSDGSGSLDATELDAAMKALMFKPSSTVEFAQQRGGQDDDLFSKVDANGDGSIDSDELQALQDRMGIEDDDAMSRLDSDGDGSLSAEEFDAGRPQNDGQGPQGGTGGTGGPGGMPPPPRGDGDGESADAASSSSSTTYDPLDTNQDGVVSAQERAAGELKEAMQKLLEAANSNGDDSIDAAEATAMQDALAQALQSATSSDASSGSGSASSSDQGNALQQQSARLAELLVQQYASVGKSSGFASTGTQLNVTA